MSGECYWDDCGQLRTTGPIPWQPVKTNNQKPRWRWITNQDHRFGGYWYSNLTELAYMWSERIQYWNLVEWSDAAAGLAPWPDYVTVWRSNFRLQPYPMPMPYPLSP